MTRTTINMIVAGKQISFEAEAKNGVQEDISMYGPFKTAEEAIEMFGKEIPSLEYFLTTNNATPIQTEKKEEPMTTETKPAKTLALNIILPGDLGKVGMSKEFLEKTGTERDVKLIKMDKDGNIVVYDISLMQLAGRCSKKVQETVEAYMAQEIKKIKAAIAQPPVKPELKEAQPVGKIFRPVDGGKKKAEDTIISTLKEKITDDWGKYLGESAKAQLMADLTGRAFSAATAEVVQLTTEKGTLFVHVPHNVYNSDRMKWGEVIEAFRVACRKSRLEYSRPRDGKLPITARAVRKGEL